MRRSLRLRHFATVLAMTIIVVVSNRQFAQFTTARQLRLELHTDMQASLVNCTHVNDSPDAGAQCLKQSFKNKLYNHFAGEISTCQNDQSVGEWSDPAACALLADNKAFWSNPNFSLEPDVQLVVNTLGGQIWHVAKLTDQPELRIMMSERAFQSFLKKVYAIRDNQLPVFLPLLLLIVLIMAHFLVKVTLGPLDNLKNSLKNLKPENFNLTGQITTPYREFDDFISVYHQLLQRLDESFTKAKRFSADAAHEVRTPLAILRGQAEGLIAEAPTGSTLQVRLRSMADEIERLIDISQKLVLLSQVDDRKIPDDLTDVDLSEVMEELAESLAIDHPDLSIEKDIQADVHWHCNRSLVQLLIHNLSSNAVKYNVPHGQITLALQRHGEMLELWIENSAANLPKDLTERAFDRFYRGDSARNRQVDGLGLGLSLCKEIAAMHQSTLTLRVTPAQTVIACLRVPLDSAVTS